MPKSTHVILPDSTRTYQCQVPGCGCGGEMFLNYRAFQRHVTRSIRVHRDSITALSEQRAAEIDADPFQRVYDPEALEFVLANGGYKKKR